jgi:hypothetical protein
MLVFLLLLCAASLYKIRLTRINETYLDIQETTALKGFFIGLVFLSHMQTYLNPALGGVSYRYALSVINLFGQLMVAYFFFCSGYGVLFSFQTKKDYDKGFLKHRLLKTLVHFDIAIVIYLLVSICIGKQYDLKNYLFCWIGWESIGNSNWFIFVTLILYMITWIAFMIKRKTECSALAMIVIIIVMCCGLWIGLYYTKSSYWYNTLFCYPLGMLIALHNEKLNFILKKNLHYGVSILCSLMVFLVFYMIPNEVAYSICALAFCCIVMLISFKVEVRSPVLLWMGSL